MSGLRERLSRLKGSAAAPVASPPAPQADDEWALIGAHVEAGPAGAFVMRRRTYGLDSTHGKHRLSELAEYAQQLSCFHGEDAVVRIEELLFFDTETTGLGVGAGNAPFLIGVGYYSGELFTVEQLLMRNPAEEYAMLVYLHELLARFTHIVSYNGRTFDWPILKNRFVLNRLKLDDSKLIQLDLLYPSRSLWRNTLPSCRLSIVEESRLGFERIDDVPGSMAPELYFRYLAEKNPTVLQGVFIHNEHDIVTLAALCVHFGKLLSGSMLLEAGKAADLQSALESRRDLNVNTMTQEELYRMGIWLGKMGRPALAELVLDKLFVRVMGEDEHIGREVAKVLYGGSERQLQALSYPHQESVLLLASFYKKQGNDERAVALWERFIEASHAGISLRLEPYLELAMYYEHRAKNFRQALYYAEEAWTKLWRRRSLQRGDHRQSEAEGALEQRIRRLQAKLEKTKQEGRSQSSKASKHRGAGSRRSKPVYVSEGLI